MEDQELNGRTSRPIAAGGGYYTCRQRAYWFGAGYRREKPPYRELPAKLRAAAGKTREHDTMSEVKDAVADNLTSSNRGSGLLEL
jgi:hypothetical protein